MRSGQNAPAAQERSIGRTGLGARRSAETAPGATGAPQGLNHVKSQPSLGCNHDIIPSRPQLGRYGIRVNAVTPGFIVTEMVAAMPQKVLDGMKSHTPLGRLGDPRDIANAYLFLASEEASFITGEVLRVDGGMVVGT